MLIKFPVSPNYYSNLARNVFLTSSLCLVLYACSELKRCENYRLDWDEQSLILIAAERYAVGDLSFDVSEDGVIEAISAPFPATAEEFLKKFPECCEIVPLDSSKMWVPNPSDMKSRGYAGSVSLIYNRPYLDSNGRISQAELKSTAHIDQCGHIFDPNE